MQTIDTSSRTHEDAALPVARIDAQDETSAAGVREYLEAHAVQVVLNKSSGLPPVYHIAVGDGDFVKQIFSLTRIADEKRLGIIMGETNSDIPKSIRHAKVVLLDPTEISPASVVEIFEFFFTSDNDLLDLRTRRYSRTVHEKPQAQPAEATPVFQERVVREKNESPLLPVHDQERIGLMIADMFGSQAKPEDRRREEHKHRRRKTLRRWMVGLLILSGIVIIPLVWYFFSVAVAGVALMGSTKAFTSGNISSVGWQVNAAKYWVGQGSMVLNIAAPPLRLIGQEYVIRGQERLVSFLSDATRAQEDVRTMLDVGQSVAAGLLNQVDVTSTGTTPAADITKLRMSLSSVQNTLGLAQAQLVMLTRDRTFPFSIPLVARQGTRAVSELVALRDSAGSMDKLLSLFLQLAGFKEPRRYLILLQNSAELRPTGGFIGSVAVASFADGRLTNLEIQDVYVFDGQLKGHVEPPVPVRELLGQEHWYLRDSNWDPDFAASGERAAWFYQKETGNAVDGVFALNTPFIVEVLKATGPIDLPDYDDRITADNFYGKSLHYTQNDFFPGSTQKRDFLGTLARALIATITTGKTTNTPKLFRAITTSLTSHDILMMFGSVDLQSLVEHYGWAGRVPSSAGCIGADANLCREHPLTIIEANMGINKVNAFVSRTISRQIAVDADGTLTEAVTLDIRNEDTTGASGTGWPYRAYVRFLLPQHAAVGEATLDGIPVASRARGALTLPYIESMDEGSGAYGVGIAFDVPASTQKRLTISYTRSAALTFMGDEAVLDVRVAKQPGVANSSIVTIIRYPLAWSAGIEEQGGTPGFTGDFIAKTGQLEYNMILDRDRTTRIRFTK